MRQMVSTRLVRELTIVAANVHDTARNPVSGMTMLTIIISCAVLLRFGLSGTTGMFFVMGLQAWCAPRYPSRDKPSLTSKSATGWARLPSAQEKVKFLGVIAAAIAAGLTIVMLARTFQFGEALPGDLRPVFGFAPSVDHESAGRRLHEPSAPSPICCSEQAP